MTEQTVITDTMLLERIADALERIAAHLEGVPREMAQMEQAHPPHDATYEAAVQALIDMPDDIPEAAPEAPVKFEKTDVVSALNKCASVHGVEAAKKVLTKFGGRLDDVPPEKYADLIAVLGAM